MIVLYPESLCYGSFFANSAYLPAIHVAGSNSRFPYTTAAYTQVGTFTNQYANIVSYVVDSMIVDFTET